MSNQYLGDDRIVHESIDVSKASSRRIYSNSEAPDDIVTRLREEAANRRGHWDTLTEAADEIQSLRAKLALTEDEMVRMARMMSEMTESYRQLREEYEKVRGDA